MPIGTSEPTVTRAPDHIVLPVGQVSPALCYVVVLTDRHARHPSQFQLVEHGADGQDDDVHALDTGVDGVRDRVLLVDVGVAVRDDNGQVRDVASVAIARREHVVLL